MNGFWCETHRDALDVTGDDALAFLQSQISQDISKLAIDDSAYTFVLQPTGKVETLARVTKRSATEFLIDTDAGFGEALRIRLNRFKIRVKVDIEPVDLLWISVRGTVERPAMALPAWGRADSYDLAGSTVEPPADATQANEHALTFARIAAGWPEMGAEITASTIPAETGIVSLAVNFTKGCYPGQELVERMDSRGSQAPRFVRRLRGTGPATVGDEISHDGKPVGTLTSVASTGDGWMALAVIARSVQPGDVVTVRSGTAAVEATETDPIV